jgi:alginate O-acetyltransferase complex protein AlgI
VSGDRQQDENSRHSSGATMIFVSYWFVVFALCFLSLYWVARNRYARLVILGAGCVVFHLHFAGPAGVLPIVFLGTTTYVLGLTRSRIACTLGMIVCVCALLFYKYLHFLTQSVIGAIAPEFGQQLYSSSVAFLPSAPPLGISFFVFEFVHYLFEVRRGHKPITNPLHFGVFAIFWPSLVAGPIKRYSNFIPSVLGGLSAVSPENVVNGILRVTSGLFKKALADNLTIWLDYHSAHIDTIDPGTRWLLFFGLAFRIYWDFSGYSDMAIGYAQMMGIRLPENFRWPYLARDLNDFWQRWHISLSSWIRDYVYIPLGGNRHGLPRRIVNGILAFAICGLWHGADWNFLAWGLYHGIGLAVGANYQKALGPIGRNVSMVFRELPVLGIVLTFLYVSIGWVLFFYPLPQALHVLELLVKPQ